MRIVVVEDEIRIREGLCNLIGKISAEYEILGQASNGKEGMELILFANPDLIITDVRMPVMDGIEMLRLLKEKGIHKKAVILSAFTEFEYAKQAIVLGVSEYLVKPITVPALTETLARLNRQIEFDRVMGAAPNRNDAVDYTYPIHIENDIKKSICACDWNRTDYFKECFANYYKSAGCSFSVVKEAYVRFIWAISSVSKEIGMLSEEKTNDLSVFECVSAAQGQAELAKALDAMLEALRTPKENTDETASLTVNRAIALIHEFYQAGITLDEIADKLNLTPEYLGTLFREKTGVHFTTYMKNHRTNKAKALLIGTQMKLAEIAQSVGYSDPKYFSKVFKESTGFLPSQYRALNK